MKTPGVNRIWQQPTLLAGLFLLFLVALMSRQPAAAVVADGSWVSVESATVVQGGRVYARGVGFYTDNTVTNNSAALTGDLRLVVTSSTYPVTNAAGTDDNGMPYFDLISLDEITRIYFGFTRAAFAYTAEVQQYVIDEPVDSDNDGVPDDVDQCPGSDDAIDVDGDGIPDGCDDLIDSDNDGVADDVDQCPGSDDAIDVDGDGIPDGCDDLIDSDNDGVADNVDQCPGFDDNVDADNDGIPDGCDDVVLADRDQDGIPDDEDVCPDDPNNACITISGQVFGDGATLFNAAVKVGTNTVTGSTDEGGFFEVSVGNLELENDTVDDFFPVEVKAEGFATGNAKVLLVPGETSYDVTVNLQQISATVDEEDDLSAGVPISVGGEPVGSLTIPDSALPGGVIEVTGTITYLDPETDDIILSAPGGDLLAVPEGADPNDAPVTLETFGMMEFDLQDQDGNPISQLNGDAQVCMKAPAGLSLGETVPLWYYDEQAGLWKEEGQGTVVDRDGQLQICGAVTHFTWWNYDRPIETHSCFHFRFFDAATIEPLSGLEWRAEGVTYSGTSPERDCVDNVTSETWGSLTVKISDDPNNREQIRVFAMISNVKYYLRRDGEAQYSLVANASNATVFDTPTEQGSCLSGTESGTCWPLDFLDANPDGLLHLSVDINLPPVISEFNLTDYVVSINETLEAMVTVTDPEGVSPVSLNWNITCDYGFGGSPSDESISPQADSGTSGGTFVAKVTAPSTSDSAFEQCLVTVEASDAGGNTSTATRWFTVAVSLEYTFTGILYGTDGLPLANADVDYSNYYCYGSGIFDSTTTDSNGRYYFEIDFSECFDSGQIYFYLNLGNLSFDFLSPDGNLWSHDVYLDLLYGGFGTVGNCGVNSDGMTHCEIDARLPMLWAPLSGEVYKSRPNDEIWSIGAYGNYYGYYGYSNLWGALGPLSGTHDGTSYGPVLVPLGEVSASAAYESAPNGWVFWGDSVVYFTMPSLDGVNQDLTDSPTVTAPVTVTVFDELGNPLPGAEVYAYSWTGLFEIMGSLTDTNGEVMGQFGLGALFADSNPSYDFLGAVVSKKDRPVLIDLNSANPCSYTGTLFDPMGVPLALTDVWISATTAANGGESVQLTTDATGGFTVAFPAVDYLGINTVDNSLSNGFWRQLFVPNCRPVNGSSPPDIRLDFQLFEDPGGFGGL